jgi:hypothetical protein
VVLTGLLGKSLALKVVTGVIGLAFTGTAFAAEAGALPAPLQQAAYDVAGDLGVPAPDDGATEPSTAPTADPSVQPTTGTTTEPGPDPSGTPGPEPSEAPDLDPSAGPAPTPTVDGPDATGPAAKGLCQAYRSGANRDNAAQRALAEAAGGAGNVAAYCAGILAGRDAKHGKPAASATPEPTTTKAATTKATTRTPKASTTPKAATKTPKAATTAPKKATTPATAASTDRSTNKGGKGKDKPTGR